MPRKIEIELEIDGKKSHGTLKVTEAQLEGIDDQLEKTGRTATRFGRIWETAVGNLAASAIGRVTGALGNLARRGFEVLKEGVKAAQIQQIIDGKMATALRNIGEDASKAVPELYDLAGQLQNLTGVSNEEIQAAQTLLITQTQSLEGTKLLTESTLDLAAASQKAGQDIGGAEGAARLIGRAYTDNIKILGRYGIEVDEATEAQYNASEGAERLALLHDILKDKVGGFAESAADPFKIMQEAAEDAKKEIGEELLPELQVAASQVTALLQDPATSNTISRIGGIIAKVIGGILSIFPYTRAVVQGFIGDVRQSFADTLLLVHGFVSRIASGADRLGLDRLAAALYDVSASAQGAGLSQQYLASQNHAAAEAARNTLAEMRRVVDTSDKAAPSLSTTAEAAQDLANALRDTGPEGEKAAGVIEEAAKKVADLQAKLDALNASDREQLIALRADMIRLRNELAAQERDIEEAARRSLRTVDTTVFAAVEPNLELDNIDLQSLDGGALDAQAEKLRVVAFEWGKVGRAAAISAAEQAAAAVANASSAEEAVGGIVAAAETAIGAYLAQAIAAQIAASAALGPFAAPLAAAAAAAIRAVFSRLVPSFGSGRSGGEAPQQRSNVTATVSLPGRRHGGPVDAGQPYVVGEAGPEVVIPRQAGTVVPNVALQNLRIGGATPSDVALRQTLDRLSSQLDAMPDEVLIRVLDPDWGRFETMVRRAREFKDRHHT